MIFSHPETIKPVEGIPWWAYGKPPSPKTYNPQPVGGGFTFKKAEQQPTPVTPSEPSPLNPAALRDSSGMDRKLVSSPLRDDPDIARHPHYAYALWKSKRVQQKS